MIVIPVLPLTVEVSPDQNNVCLGTPVTFTATVSNGGDPAFQWYLNGVQAGSNQPVFQCVPSVGDQVFVVVSSSLQCVSGNPATSGTVLMIVNDPLPVAVSVTADQNSVCEGTPVTFTATPSNGGIPVYQWYRNSTPVGSDQATYTCVPADGDQVYAEMTSSLECITGNPATSPVVTMTVHPVVSANVSISVDHNDVCAGTSVTFTAIPLNAGVPVFQWFLNGAQAGSGESSYTYIPAHGGLVHVVMTSSLSCVSVNPVTSNEVAMSVISAAGAAGTISGPDPVCAGTEGAVFSVPSIPNSSLYSWSLPAGAGIVAGDNTESITVNFSNDAVSGDITVQGANSCGSGSPSPAFHVSVNPVPGTPVVTLQWPVLQSSAPAGNQWYYEGTLLTDSTGQTCYAGQTGWYWTVVTSLGCSSDSSNHVYFDATGPGKVVPGILVYPIPNDGQFTISITLLSPETFNVRMYNSLGKQIFELPDLLVNEKYKRVIDLRQLSKGIYTIVFKSAETSVVKKVLIVKK